MIFIDVLFLNNFFTEHGPQPIFLSKVRRMNKAAHGAGALQHLAMQLPKLAGAEG